MTIEGMLFDVYLIGSEARLWILTDKGPVLLRHAYLPKVYLEGNETTLQKAVGSLRKRYLVRDVRWVEKTEFWSGRRVQVLEIEVTGTTAYSKLSQLLPDYDGPLRIYNADLSLQQLYLYETNLFPCGMVQANVEGGEIKSIWSVESPWDDFQLPHLNVLGLEALENSVGCLSEIQIAWEGKVYSIEPEGPVEVVQELNAFLDRADPDLILTTHGDAVLFPWLLRAERLAKKSLRLDRDPKAPRRSLRTEGRTYFSYGRVLYSPPRYPLYGRWHIDRETSFMYQEGDLEGIIELARLSKVPVQTSARSSPGTAISSMQLDEAFNRDILIPWRKGEPETFKTPWTTFIADKGGLTYAPQVGIFEDVAEIDFASMYPGLMVAHNISPETVLCSCCKQEGKKVPELGYHICRRKTGLVPSVLAPILERRQNYKRRRDKAQTDDERVFFDRRQNTLKWILVTCFGYLGYRNARFGKIEAHEAVTAFGRDTLLRAKEVAEGQGYRMLHALTDSLWIEGGDMSSEALRRLTLKIQSKTRIPLVLEGIYRWVHFLPSRLKSDVGVPNRFFGVFREGGLKARGLAYRRHDTPSWIRDAQLSALNILCAAGSQKEYRNLIPRAEEEIDRWRDVLRSGDVSPYRLLINRRLSRSVSDYKMDTWTSLASRQYIRAGIRLHPGEHVVFLLKNLADPLREERVRAGPLISPTDTYDMGKYEEMLDRAAAELWSVFLQSDIDPDHLRLPKPRQQELSDLACSPSTTEVA